MIKRKSDKERRYMVEDVLSGCYVAQLGSF